MGIYRRYPISRKRIISPTFWEDEEISKWSYKARLFYIGLWNFADDDGRFKANDILLKSQIFPYEKNINDMGNLKKEISNKIQWYNVKDVDYGWLINFKKYQVINHPTPSKLPIPPPLTEQQQQVVIKEESKPKHEKLKHLDFVFLEKEEYTNLLELYGALALKEFITRLNDYIGQSGKKYKSHYYTILNWARKEGTKKIVESKPRELKRPDPKEQEAVALAIKQSRENGEI